MKRDEMRDNLITIQSLSQAAQIYVATTMAAMAEKDPKITWIKILLKYLKKIETLAEFDAISVENIDDFEALVSKFLQDNSDTYTKKDHWQQAGEDYVASLTEEEADHLEALGII